MLVNLTCKTEGFFNLQGNVKNGRTVKWTAACMWISAFHHWQPSSLLHGLNEAQARCLEGESERGAKYFSASFIQQIPFSTQFSQIKIRKLTSPERRFCEPDPSPNSTTDLTSPGRLKAFNGCWRSALTKNISSHVSATTVCNYTKQCRNKSMENSFSTIQQQLRFCMAQSKWKCSASVTEETPFTRLSTTQIRPSSYHEHVTNDLIVLYCNNIYNACRSCISMVWG